MVGAANKYAARGNDVFRISNDVGFKSKVFFNITSAHSFPSKGAAQQLAKLVWTVPPAWGRVERIHFVLFGSTPTLLYQFDCTWHSTLHAHFILHTSYYLLQATLLKIHALYDKRTIILCRFLSSDHAKTTHSASPSPTNLNAKTRRNTFKYFNLHNIAKRENDELLL